MDILVNVVSILPSEYDCPTEVEESADVDDEEMALHKPTCYFVMSNGSIENQYAFFEKSDMAMKSHLKPLLIRAKVEGVAINKVLVDCGATVNIMPHHLLHKIGKFDTDVRSYNMVLADYEGSTKQTMGVIQVDVIVGSVTRPTIFMVIQGMPSYNLLVIREWLHGIGVVPSSMHQRLMIWGEDGIVKNIEADQGYFMADVNNVSKKNFDKKLANISPCQPAEDVYSDLNEAFVSLKLHETHGFIWDVKHLEDPNDENQPTGWEDITNNV